MKKKIIIISLIIIFIIIAGILGLYFYFNYKDSQLSLINESIVIEYGESYEPSINDLIDLNKYSYIDLDKVTIKNEIENEENKDYAGVGNYLIHIYYKNIELVQKIEVKDSIGPEITISESIELPYNTDLENYDFTDYIKINDLSETKDYNIDFSNVNKEIAGEYVATIEVLDIYDNKTQKEFKIIIQEKVEETTTNEIPSNSGTQTTSNQTKAQNNNTQNTNKTSTTNNSSYKTNSNNKTEEKTNTNNNIQKCEHGNDGWYNTEADAIAVYKAKLKYWEDKWANYEIDNDTFYQNRPNGYETWDCPICHKWTINVY